MARRLKMVVFAVMAVVALLESCGAEGATHVVGDGLGWTIPPGGPIAYSTWASRYTFTVGDVLVFNFNTGAHDVAEVTKAAFDACNATSPLSISTAGPTNITLTAAGEHHFLCTFGGHCTIGQKLAINVSAAASSPPPSATTPVPSPVPTPSPVSTPAPAPSRTAVTYVVGDLVGWNVLPGGAAAYQSWAANKSFMVGDTLVFNFANGTHNVAEVTKSAYDSCNTTTTLSLTTTSPARITLTAAGQHYFTCTFPRHCSLGQQLSITVTGTTPTASSPSPASSPTATSPSPHHSTVPSPSPSTTATPPSTTTTPSSPSPSGTTTTPPPPPPSNSAPSFAVAALPVTILSIAVAFFLH